MEVADFDKALFSAGMTAEYKGELYAIASINFEEKLFGLIEIECTENCSDDDVFWVRCENAEVQL